MSRREAWNDRYAAKDLVWGAEPNRFLAEAFGEAPARGRALDLACGEGRNAIWLAERGWRVTGVDFSRVAIERGRERARRKGVEVELIEADATVWKPEPGAYALAVVLYLQVPPADRRAAWAHALAALAPGGELFAVGHALRNLDQGTGGPGDPAVLWDPSEVAAELRELGAEVDRAGEVLRPVEGAEVPAIDTRIVAHRPVE